MLAFPCNQFGAQEPGTDAEILEFATSNYDANFPMFSKIDVNGESAAPLYQWLRSQAPGEAENGDIAWNFTKFLVDGAGNVINRYEPMTSPEDIAPDIEAAVG